MSRMTSVICFLCLVLFGNSSHAQVSATVDPDGFVVLSGSDVDLTGVNLWSEGGNLVPNPDYESDPFDSVWGNPTGISYGNHRGLVPLDGELKLSAAYDLCANFDLAGHWRGRRGDGALTITAPILTESQILSCTVNASVQQIGDDYRLQLAGVGQELSSVQFDSPSGSLIPATAAAPFDTISENSQNRISFSAAGSVTLDGSLTTSAGYDRVGGLKDITYGYQQVGVSEERGPLTIDSSAYPFRVEPTPVSVRVAGGDYKLQLNGYGQELRSFQFDSPSGSMFPATDAGAFDSITENTPNRVSFASDGYVTLHGSLTTSVGYDRFGGQPDITFRYRQVGIAEEQGPFTMSGDDYPQVNPSPIEVWMRGDGENNYRFVLYGNRHELRSFRLDSPSGSLIPAPDAGPFQSIVENSSDQISFAADGVVWVDGSLTTSAGFDAFGERDVSYRYVQYGDDSEWGPFELNPWNYPPTPPIVDVRVRSNVENDYRFELRGEGQELRSFHFDSASGSLIPAANARPFNNLTENSRNRISFAAESPVKLDGRLIVSAGFDLLGGQRDVTYGYEQNGTNRQLGPFPVESYPRVPAVEVSLNDNFNFVVAGNGQLLNELSLTSNGRSLIPSDNPAPFASFGRNTDSNIDYEGGPVIVDGEVTLAAKWNRVRGVRDVRFQHDVVQESSTKSGFVSGYPPRAPTTPLQVEIERQRAEARAVRTPLRERRIGRHRDSSTVRGSHAERYQRDSFPHRRKREHRRRAHFRRGLGS